MATTLNTIYPPVLPTAIPAFDATANNGIVNIPVSVSVSSYNDWSDVSSLQFSIVNAKTNKNVLSAVDAASGSTYKPQVYVFSSKTVVDMDAAGETKTFYIPVNADNIIPGELYKVQVRFASSLMPTPKMTINSSLSELKTYLASTAYFSEWSQICLIKPILPGEIVLTNFGDMLGMPKADGYIDTAVYDVPAFNRGVFIISGKYEPKSADNLKDYIIKIYDATLGQYIYETEKRYPATQNEIVENLSTLNFEYNLIDSSHLYYVCVDMETANGYKPDKKYFPFYFAEYQEGPEFIFDVEVDNHDGIIEITATPKDGGTIPMGYLYISRSCDSNKFKDWQILEVASISATDSITSYSFTDYTANSFNYYRYSIQWANVKGLLGKPSTTSNPRHYAQNDEESNTGVNIGYAKKEKCNRIFPQFEDIIFTRYDESSGKYRQLAVRFDYVISNYKPTVNRAKIETLGSKYPKFAENALMNYRAYSISGKISAQEDINEKFITRDETFEQHCKEDYYALKKNGHDWTENIDAFGDSIFKGYSNNFQTANTEPACFYHWDNWHEFRDWRWEKEFRDAAVAWLNDGEPKLYRSITEGALCVMLTDINLTPETVLGRRLYNFTAMMYEVGDGHDIQTLKDLGIIHFRDDRGIFSKNDIDITWRMEEPIIGQRYSLNNRNVGTRFYIENPSSFNFVDYVYEYYDNRLLGENRKIDRDSVYLTNVRIKFRSLPHMFTDVNSRSLTEQETANSSKFSLLMGYRVNAIVNGEQKILFVPKEGYLQFPEPLKVTSLEFPDLSADVVDVDYIFNYATSESLDAVASTRFTKKYIIGQECGEFFTDLKEEHEQKLSDRIKGKYSYDESDSTGKKIATYYLSAWNGISIYANAYTIAKIKYEGIDAPMYNEIGATRMLRMMEDFNIEDLSFVGRRMIRNTDPMLLVQDNMQHDKTWMREHEFYLYPEEFYSKSEIKYPIHNFVYNIVGWNDSTDYAIYHDGEFYSFYPIPPDGTRVDTDTSNQLVWDNANDATAPNAPIQETEGLRYNSEWANIFEYKSHGFDFNFDMGVAAIPVSAQIDFVGQQYKIAY